MKAQDLMKRDILSAQAQESVAELCDRLQAAHVHCAPVVDANQRLLGIVSTEDLLFGGVFGRPGGETIPGSEGARENGSARVGEIMTAPVISTTPDASINEVAALMWAHRIHHVPVVDDEGRLRGIVSSLDLCRVVLDRAG